MIRDLRGWSKVRRVVLGRDGGRCVLCGSVERLEVDHVRPVSIGGTNSLNNIRTLCKSCHVQKSRYDIQNAATDRMLSKPMSKTRRRLKECKELLRRRYYERRSVKKMGNEGV